MGVSVDMGYDTKNVIYWHTNVKEQSSQILSDFSVVIRHSGTHCIYSECSDKICDDYSLKWERPRCSHLEGPGYSSKQFDGNLFKKTC